jgi:hypothetical protein
MCADSPAALDALARRFTGWRFWWSHNEQGEPVALNATRRRRLTEAELREGPAQTLPYGHSANLLDQLELQSWRYRADGSRQRTW